MTYHVEIIMEGTAVRFELFGECHNGRFVAFFDRDTTMQMARVLGDAARQLPASRKQPRIEDLTADDLA